MNNELNCPFHLKEKVKYVCLERFCQSRLSCESCLILSHSKNHKIENLNHVMNKGFVNIVAEALEVLTIPVLNEQEYGNGIKLAMDELKKDLEVDLLRIKQTEVQLQDLSNSINQDLKKKANGFQQIDTILKTKYMSHSELEKYFQENIEKAYKITTDPQLGMQSTITKFKNELLSTISSEYIRIITLTLRNAFMTGVRNLLVNRLEVLKRDIGKFDYNDMNFHTFLDSKFRGDGIRIEHNLEAFLSTLTDQVNVLLGDRTILLSNPMIPPQYIQTQYMPQTNQQPLIPSRNLISEEYKEIDTEVKLSREHKRGTSLSIPTNNSLETKFEKRKTIIPKSDDMEVSKRSNKYHYSIPYNLSK